MSIHYLRLHMYALLTSSSVKELSVDKGISRLLVDGVFSSDIHRSPLVIPFVERGTSPSVF